MATTPALEVRDLQKSFGGVPVLRGVSLSLSHFLGQVTGPDW
jgi:ABC-type sugar transport system ATPase subunit